MSGDASEGDETELCLGRDYLPSVADSSLVPSNSSSNGFDSAKADENQRLLERVECLEKENLQLKSRLSVFFKGEGGAGGQEVDSSFFHVVYQNIPIEAREEMDEFVNELLKRHKLGDTAADSRNGNHLTLGSIQYHDLFIRDKILPNNSAEFSDSRIYQIPYYNRNSSAPLSHEGVQNVSVSSMECFNCGSKNHAYAECTHPRDERRVRNAIRAWRVTREDTEVRYWNEKKPGKFVTPGLLSDRLKEALNMSQGQQPPYYKRMKIYGYPPSYYLYNMDKSLNFSKEDLNETSTWGDVEGNGGVQGSGVAKKSVSNSEDSCSVLKNKSFKSRIKNSKKGGDSNDSGDSENANNLKDFYVPLQSFENRTVYYEGLDAPDYPEPFCPPILARGGEGEKFEQRPQRPHQRGHFRSDYHRSSGNNLHRRRHGNHETLRRYGDYDASRSQKKGGNGLYIHQDKGDVNERCPSKK